MAEQLEKKTTKFVEPLKAVEKNCTLDSVERGASQSRIRSKTFYKQLTPCLGRPFHTGKTSDSRIDMLVSSLVKHLKRIQGQEKDKPLNKTI